MAFFEDHKDGLILNILVQPRSSKNTIAGIHGDALKIRVTSPPVDGAANKTCIELLAKQVNMPKSSLEILSGDTGRRKRIAVHCQNRADRDRIRKYFQRFC